MNSKKYRYTYNDIVDILQGVSLWHTGNIVSQEDRDCLTLYKNKDGHVVRFLLHAAKHTVQNNIEVAHAYANDIEDDYITLVFSDIMPEQ